jgi:hypothetical protein
MKIMMNVRVPRNAKALKSPAAAIQGIELIKEGWAQVPQEYINRMVSSYPQRFHDVIASDGQITGW